MLYRCRHDRDVAFRKELDGLVAEHGIRVAYLVSDRSLWGRPAPEWLRSVHLASLLPDLAERDVYICGPRGLADQMLDVLAKLGVRPGQVHTEAFSF